MKQNFEDLLISIKRNTSREFWESKGKADKERSTALTFFLVIAGLLDIVIISFLFDFVKSLPIFGILFILIPIFIADIIIYAIINAMFFRNRKQFKIIYKKEIIEKLLSNFYSKVNYLPGNKMPNEIYNQAQYNEYYNVYYSDDYMEGLINNRYFFKMAEVHTIDEETSTDSNGNTTTTRTTKFHGLFAKIQLNKSINTRLCIMENHRISKKNKLEMDSEEFEKFFDVSSDNKIVGMQLLTHDVMELLVSFKKIAKIKYDVVIINDFVYLRFHTGTMFEFSNFKNNIFDEKSLKKYYDILDFTYSLSNILTDLIDKTEV